MTEELLKSITAKDVVYIAFFTGVLWAEFRILKKELANAIHKIDDLKSKVEKHNSFDRRIVRLETICEVKGAKDDATNA